MTWIDAHCHLDLPPLDQTLDSTLDWLETHQIRGFILGGCHPEMWSSHAQVAHRFSSSCRSIQWTIGHHPMYVAQQGWNPYILDQMSSWLTDSLDDLPSPCRPSGFGELGLDRRKIYQESFELQYQAFRDQWALVRQFELPVVLHVVRAHSWIFEVFKKDGPPPCGGIVHAFNGSFEVAQQYLKWNVLPSIGSFILHPQAKKLKKVVQALDPCQWVIETDSPDQPPLTLSRDELPPTCLHPQFGDLNGSSSFEGPSFHTPLSIYRIAYEIGRIRDDDKQPLKHNPDFSELRSHPITHRFLNFSKKNLKSFFHFTF